MNRSTDQALRSLLPTHNGAFPPALADLAGSLLAQSRHRASALKADEEIARSYACANLACERLKTALNLPPIEPRPPIQPRLYRRLYTHLSTVLKPAPAASRASLGSPARTPRGGRAARGSTRVTPTATPTRDRPRPAMKMTATPGRGTPSGRAKSGSGSGSASAFPPWLRPTVRFVCDRLGQPQLAPTVMAGLATIHRAAHEEEEDSKRSRTSTNKSDDAGNAAWVGAHQTALAAALYYYCAASWRAGGQASGKASDKASGTGASAGDLDQAQYVDDEKAILGAFRQARQGVSLPAVGGGSATAADDDADVWEAGGWRDLTRHRFRDALLVVSERQWLQSDWFTDIQRLGGGGEDGQQARDDDDDDDDDGDDGRPTRAWRADGMLQERYDYLSAAKTEAYAAWKDAMLQELAGREEAMAVDV